MKAKTQELRTFSARKIGLAVLALALALSLWLVVAAPQAQAATVKLDGARTTLTTDPGTTTTLFSAGIIPLPVWPTPVVPTSDAAKYTFPVTGGAVDAKTLAGSIRHSGGLLLGAHEHQRLEVPGPDQLHDQHHRQPEPHGQGQRWRSR